MLGKNILGSGVDFDLYTAVGAGAYICGEETALLESLEGKQGKPRFKPPFPANFGLYGAPTTINNTQSYAVGAHHPAQGRGVVRGAGRGERRRHGDLLGVRPRRTSPATSKCRMGIPFAELLEIAGGMKGGRKLKAVHSRRLVGARGAGRQDHGREHGLRLAEGRGLVAWARPRSS